MSYIQKYLLLFVRYSWLMILLIAAGVGFAYVQVDKQPNVYGATAVLEVTSGTGPILNINQLQDERIGSLDVINTVVESLSSNDVMLAVAQAIDRSKEWAASSPEGKVPAEKQHSLAQSVRNQIRVTLKRGTRLIEVNAEDGSPAMAQKIAEETVMQFLKLHNVDVSDISRDTIKSLMDEETKMFEKLSASTLKRDEFARSKGIVTRNDPLASQESDVLRAQLAASTSRAMALEADVAAIKKVQSNDVAGLLRISAVAGLPDVTLVRSALIEKETEFSAIKERYLERHPKYLEAERAIADLKKQLNAAVAAAGNELERQLESVKAEQTRLKTIGSNILPNDTESADYLEFQALQRTVENDQTLYDNVKKRRGELELVGGMDKAPPYKISKPLLNPVALRPNRQKSMTDAGLIALALAVGLIILIDRLDASIRTVDDAEKQLGLPVLAAVPEGDLSKIPRTGTVMTDAAGSSQAEAFRTLRASLSLLGDESKRRLILVTSAIPSEGKTFTSINLAACLAGQGYRTLLVDADLRRPALSVALMDRDVRKGEEYRGLTDVLSANIKPAEAIRDTSVPNLFLLPAGRKAPNPSELLAQSTLPALMAGLEGQFDRVVFDTAPINAVSDTLGLSSHAHCVILVLRFGRTPKRAVQRALQMLKKAGAKISGLVMNRVPAKRGAAYYYYYYGDPYIKDSVYGSANKKKRPKSRQVAEESRTE